MSVLAGHTAGPNGLTFFEGTHEYLEGNNIILKNIIFYHNLKKNRFFFYFFFYQIRYFFSRATPVTVSHKTKNIPIDDTACLIPPYDGRIPVLPSLTANLNQNII